MAIKHCVINGKIHVKQCVEGEVCHVLIHRNLLALSKQEITAWKCLQCYTVRPRAAVCTVSTVLFFKWNSLSFSQNLNLPVFCLCFNDSQENMEFILEEETNSSEFYSEDQTEQNMKFLYSCSYSYDYKVRLHSKKSLCKSIRA